MSVLRYTRLIDSIISKSKPNESPTIDSFGHTRAVYNPLKIYSSLLTGNAGTALRQTITTLDNSIWSMLAIHLAGKIFHEPAWIDRAAAAFDRLIDQQQITGEFLAANQTMNPESRWYEELTTLHAVASYTVRVPTPKRISAVKRNAEYHLEQTQPDHATAEPWGLFAFIQHAPPLADQVLHAMQMQYPQGPAGVPLLLLRDTLYGLQLLTTDNGPLTTDQPT